ncbi:MAG: sulfatase-like hydrolase/transferase [Planctomycetales bacterium]|nr:sulfatase-like hydrolase/transferase [Planctomycetales bacterium]
MSRKLIIFGVDGLATVGTYALGQVGVSTPYLDSLMDGSWEAAYAGAYALDSQAGGEVGTDTEQATLSPPGWTTLFTSVWDNRHLVTGTSFTNWEATGYLTNPTFLQTLKLYKPNVHVQTWIASGFIIDNIIGGSDPTVVDDNDTTADIGTAMFDDIAAYVAALDTDADELIYAYTARVDNYAHSDIPNTGTDDSGYGATIQTLDTLIGSVLTAIAARTNFDNEDWMIILCSDHGQLAIGGHGAQSTNERSTALIVAGKRVTQGAAVAGEVTLASLAPTALDYFGIATPTHYEKRQFGDGGELVVSLPDLSNLTEQYEATNTGSITKDGSNKVSAWNDLSGGDRHLLQADTNKQPLYVADGGDGQPVIRFDGVDDFLRHTSAGLLAGFTAYMYLANKDTAQTTQCYFDTDAGSNEGYCRWETTAGGQFRDVKTGTHIFPAAAATVDDLHTVVVMYTPGILPSAGGLRLWLNGSEVTPSAVTDTTVGGTNPSGRTIGARESATGNPAQIDVRAAIFYNGQHDTSTRNAVLAYLQALAVDNASAHQQTLVP